MRIDALDALNFFLADVRGGLGPYVNVLLLTDAHWSQSAIGAVLTVSGLIGVAAHPAVGAFIDETHRKREAIVIGAFVLAACALAIVNWPTVPVVLAADVTMAVLGGLFAPAVAAMTVGLANKANLPMRLGRNVAFDRAGNIFIALLVSAVALALSQRAPFYLAPFFAILTATAAFSIPAAAINDDRARGLAANAAQHRPKNWRVLLDYKPLLVFAGAAALFHFANAPMLPLIAQKLALANPGWETGLTSVSIIMAQLVTIGMAMLVTRANSIGRKPLLTLAFAALLSRGALCVWFDDPKTLLLLQALDGVGFGLFDALLPLILADLMEGTGHYSLARGAVGAIQGVGGSISQGAAGFVVAWLGYGAAFFALASVAAAGLLLVAALLPETMRAADRRWPIPSRRPDDTNLA